MRMPPATHLGAESLPERALSDLLQLQSQSYPPDEMNNIYIRLLMIIVVHPRLAGRERFTSSSETKRACAGGQI